MTSQSNPWRRADITPVQAVLLALSMDPKSLETLSATADLQADEARKALEALCGSGLAIPENGAYELSGPLSWFGNFEAAVHYYARRKLLVMDGEDTHLYLIDVRVKGGRPAGDPLTETLGVFACGKTARDIRPAAAQDAPTCGDCARVGVPD